MSLKALLEKLGPAAIGEVDAPELGHGVKVHVRRFSLADRQSFMDAAKARVVDGGEFEPIRDRYRRILPMCVCDANGQPEFDTGDPAVDHLPGGLADRIIDAAMRFNTEGRDDAKKSSPTPRVGSSSA